ncbi:MAG TPA: universal stress protein [Methylomirabilota bacterium]|nr:universal stress protein [Methylomirabilota bacterium]
MTRRVLHPTDFSKASGAAFARALTEARQQRSELLLVHVLAPVVPMAGAGEAYVSPTMYEQMAESARAWAQKQMDRLLAKAKAARVRARGLLLEGVAHEQIVRTAKRQRAGLIVMGTHGRTGMARFFLGSVAARVAATAPCPVLTVRGR